ncbi:phthiocerol/phthiodiolone dimycocerosyl transferase family protein [Nostoc sp.]|uniref:phthiocerol/phthiodiolone dimycocerosyl transferase family protein n=1 Tax=Nostoc sp. TaxID=1180 RepID=UPI002FF9730A
MLYDRKLSSNEKAFEILNRCADSSNIVTISRIKGLFTAEILRQVLDIIQHEHPWLNSRIVGDLDNLSFETGTSKIPLRIEEKEYAEQYQEVVSQELNQKMQSAQILIRTVLVKISKDKHLSYLITTTHHAISDGLSCMSLHSQIFKYCQRLASGEIIDEINIRPPLPPFTELLSARMQRFRSKLKLFIFLFKYQLESIKYKPQVFEMEKYVPLKERSCGMIQKRLNNEKTTQLKKLCKSNNTTVHNAICAAMLLASARKLVISTEMNIQLKCQSTIDLRKRIQPVIRDEVLGVFTSTIKTFHNINKNTNFWELAREIKQKLDIDLKKDDIFNKLFILDKHYNFLIENKKISNSTSVNVTNIGQVSIPKIYGHFELEEISFIPTIKLVTSLVAVSTFQGTMILNFPYIEPCISRETMETFANNVIYSLLNIAVNY